MPGIVSKGPHRKQPAQPNLPRPHALYGYVWVLDSDGDWALMAPGYTPVGEYTYDPAHAPLGWLMLDDQWDENVGGIIQKNVVVFRANGRMNRDLAVHTLPTEEIGGYICGLFLMDSSEIRGRGE